MTEYVFRIHDTSRLRRTPPGARRYPPRIRPPRAGMRSGGALRPRLWREAASTVTAEAASVCSMPATLSW